MIFRAAMANQTEMECSLNHILTKVNWFRISYQWNCKERLSQKILKKQTFGHLSSYYWSSPRFRCYFKRSWHWSWWCHQYWSGSKLPLRARLSGRIIHRQTGWLSIRSSIHQQTEEDYYQREDDKPETVKRRLDVNIAQKVNLFYRITESKI